MREGPTPAINDEETGGRFRKYYRKVAELVAQHPKHKPLDKDGLFYPDPQPIAPPIGYNPEPSMFDRVRDMVHRELSRVASDQDMETFEESDDFDVDDDYTPFSPYELIMEQPHPDAPARQPDPSQPAAAAPGAPPVTPATPSAPPPESPPKTPAGPPEGVPKA